MHRPLRQACLALLCVAAAPAARAFDSSDRSIEPTIRVGAVTEESSEADLVAVYGSTAVTREVTHESQDAAVNTTILFAGTPDEVRIEWKEDDRVPRRTVIGGGAWKTPEGLTVGIPMAELEKINGGPFDVTGANWDRPVRVVSWKGGKLPPRLQVDLAPSNPDSPLPRKLQSQRLFFESTHPVLKKSNLVVKRLILEW